MCNHQLMESFLSGERTNNFQWCPVKMASCTFVPILSNNTEKELYSIDYRYNYTTAGCADILFMGSIEYVCIGAASPLWARGQKFTTCLFATKRTGADDGYGTKHLLMMGKNKEVKMFVAPIFQKCSIVLGITCLFLHWMTNCSFFFIRESSENICCKPKY